MGIFQVMGPLTVESLTVRQKLIKLESVMFGNELTGDVRQKLIKLESVMFGNELTEGVLPLEVLPQRVLALCEDLGVQPKGSTRTMSLAHMSSLLDEVASHALCEDFGVQPQGSTETMSLAHMSSLLDKVASHVGV
eukprot:gene29819-12732_t